MPMPASSNAPPRALALLAAFLAAAVAGCALIKKKPTAQPTAAPEQTAQAARTAPQPRVERSVTILVKDSSGRVIESSGPQPQITPPEAAAPATPSPTPIIVKPRENFVARLWRKVFPPKKRPAQAQPPVWVGRIALVDEEARYVLVDGANLFSLTPGDVLNCVGDVRETGVVRVTADRKPPFFIADIVAGKPKAGDRVYSPKL